MKSLMLKKNGARAGLSLIELIVVIAVMAVIAAVVVPNIGDFTGRAQTVQSDYNVTEQERVLNLWRAAGGDQGTLTDADLISALGSTAPGTSITGATETQDSLLIRLGPQ